ncbi:MAG: hypothetical protein WCG06_01195, partial [Candidatus Omnitrophota bacterium]
SKKALEFASASLTRTETVLKMVQKPVLSVGLDENLTLCVRNIGPAAAESLKGYYRILYDNQGIVAEGESGFFKQTLDTDQSMRLRTMLTVPLKDPRMGFLFFVVRIDSPSLAKNCVRIFYKNLTDNAPVWSEADSDLWNLAEPHRQTITRELREMDLKF